MTGDRTKAKLALHNRLERLWGDPRFVDGRERGEDLREFITAWFWARYEHGTVQDAVWKSLRARIRRSGDQHYLWGLYRADAPRFEPSWEAYRRCEVPKTRGPNTGEPCGRANGTTFRVTNPATGEWRLATFCRQHDEHGRAARAAEQALVNVPEPLPNTGGLLPSYIGASNWPDMYAGARRGWKPPYVGIVADDWPVLAKATTAPVGKLGLTVIEGGRGHEPVPVHGGIQLGTPAPDRAEPPALRLVGDA